MSKSILTNNEINNIELAYKDVNNIMSDEIIKLRNNNLQKIQPWIKHYKGA